MYDSGLSAFQYQFPFVHYSVFAFQPLPTGEIANAINYHFNVLVLAGSVTQQAQILNLNTSKANYLPGFQSEVQDFLANDHRSNSPLICSGWCTIKTWISVYSVIGEGHSAGYMSNTYTYGVNAGSELDVMAGCTCGTSWTISGSSDEQSGVTQTWTPLYYGGVEAESRFDYAEQRWVSCAHGCVYTSALQIIQINYDGGALPWSQAPEIEPWPGDCKTLSTIEADHVSYNIEYPGDSITYYDSNGWRYSYSVGLSGAGGGNNGYVTIGDTTYYQNHQSMFFQFPNNEPVYYLYSTVSGSWPVVLASSDYCN